MFLYVGGDGGLPLEILGDGGTQEEEWVHSGDGGFSQDDRWEWGCVLPEVHNILIQFGLFI